MERAMYTRVEIAVDSFVHGIGFALAVVGTTFLVLEASVGDTRQIVAVAVYMGGMIAMLSSSAMYNMSRNGGFKRIARRLDHASIFLMIAGSYTPFALISIGGDLGVFLMVVVWSGAIAGVVWKVGWPNWNEKWSTLLYLALGWVIVSVIHKLYEAMSAFGLTFMVLGGLSYTVGVFFYRWERLPFHNVIWHIFVLLGAGAHYAVVIAEVVRPLELVQN